MKRRFLVLTVLAVAILVEVTAVTAYVYLEQQTTLGCLTVSCGCSGAGLLVCPPVSKEALTMKSWQVYSPTNVSLTLKNTGSVVASLSSYFVLDSSGNQYARLNWGSGPSAFTTSISPNSLATGFLTIQSSCGNSCTLTGSNFTYTSGLSYTLKVVTTRNNQFVFPITA
jgi:hypothetical protein